ncbi:MAG: Fe-S cluster assembly protein SufD [Peptostreptococcaceae bacterium]|nr:Fe-S cluster assembly protein SufD [Peptostreptococcaceae bacterium]
MQQELLKTLDNCDFRLENYKKYIDCPPPKWKRINERTEAHRQWKDFDSVRLHNEDQPGLMLSSPQNFICDKKEDLHRSRYTIGPFFRREVYALYNQGRHIRIEAGKKIDRPLLIDFRLDKDNDSLTDFQIIELEEGAEASVLIRYRSEDEEAHYKNSVLRVVAGKNARLKLCRIQNLNLSSKSYDDTEFDVKEGAVVDYYSLELGGSVNAVSSTAYLKGHQASIRMLPAYLADRGRKCDLCYSAIFDGTSCTGSINGNGAVSANSKKVFRGNLYFERGSSRSVGREGSFDILLDKSVKAHSIPTLFCDEDDVIGEHYASIGKIDEKKLLYLMSRGLSKEQAKKIVVESSFRPVLDNIDDEEIRAAVYESLDQRLLSGGI